MKCLQCGKRIGVLGLRTSRHGQFCSEEHRIEFLARQEQLALACLIDAQQASHARRRPPPKPAAAPTSVDPAIQGFATSVPGEPVDRSPLPRAAAVAPMFFKSEALRPRFDIAAPNLSLPPAKLRTIAASQPRDTPPGAVLAFRDEPAIVLVKPTRAASLAPPSLRTSAHPASLQSLLIPSRPEAPIAPGASQLLTPPRPQLPDNPINLAYALRQPTEPCPLALLPPPVAATPRAVPILPIPDAPPQACLVAPTRLRPLRPRTLQHGDPPLAAALRLGASKPVPCPALPRDPGSRPHFALAPTLPQASTAISPPAGFPAAAPTTLATPGALQLSPSPRSAEPEPQHTAQPPAQPATDRCPAFALPLATLTQLPAKSLQSAPPSPVNIAANPQPAPSSRALPLYPPPTAQFELCVAAVAGPPPALPPGLACTRLRAISAAPTSPAPAMAMATAPDLTVLAILTPFLAGAAHRSAALPSAATPQLQTIRGQHVVPTLPVAAPRFATSPAELSPPTAPVERLRRPASTDAVTRQTLPEPVPAPPPAPAPALPQASLFQPCTGIPSSAVTQQPLTPPCAADSAIPPADLHPLPATPHIRETAPAFIAPQPAFAPRREALKPLNAPTSSDFASQQHTPSAQALILSPARILPTHRHTPSHASWTPPSDTTLRPLNSLSPASSAPALRTPLPATPSLAGPSALACPPIPFRPWAPKAPIARPHFQLRKLNLAGPNPQDAATAPTASPIPFDISPAMVRTVRTNRLKIVNPETAEPAPPSGLARFSAAWSKLGPIYRITAVVGALMCAGFAGFPRVAATAASAGSADADSPLAQFEQRIASRAAVALNDDFREGLAHWHGESGWSRSWTYDRAGFVQTGRLAVFKPSHGLTDYRFEFMGQIQRGSIGWTVRSHDPNNYQAIKLTLKTNGPVPEVALVRYPVVRGRQGKVVERYLNMDLRLDTVYRVVTDVRGADFSVSVQGRLADYWTDPALKAGGVGFFSSKGEQARVRYIDIQHNYDMLGRLCALLAPPSQPGSSPWSSQ